MKRLTTLLMLILCMIAFTQQVDTQAKTKKSRSTSNFSLILTGDVGDVEVSEMVINSDGRGYAETSLGMTFELKKVSLKGNKLVVNVYYSSTYVGKLSGTIEKRRGIIVGYNGIYYDKDGSKSSFIFYCPAS